MGRGLVRIKDKYCEWSTIVDCPVTYLMTIQELEAWTKAELGNEGLRELPERLKRVEETGTSFHGTTAQEMIEGNRAGNDETELSIDEIYEAFQPPKGDKA